MPGHSKFDNDQTVIGHFADSVPLALDTSPLPEDIEEQLDTLKTVTIASLTNRVDDLESYVSALSAHIDDLEKRLTHTPKKTTVKKKHR
jgi:uncharacterized protein YoxC